MYTLPLLLLLPPPSLLQSLLTPYQNPLRDIDFLPRRRPQPHFPTADLVGTVMRLRVLGGGGESRPGKKGGVASQGGEGETICSILRAGRGRWKRGVG